EGVARDRRLRDDAMARVIETLAEWRAVIARYRPEAEIAVATSAVRDATNREEFGRRVLEETGFAIEIIDGEEEARRTMLGIAAGLTGPSQDLLGLDIGGGSTELILARAGQSLIVRSMDVGVVRLTELALHGDPPSHSEREHAVSLVRVA